MRIGGGLHWDMLLGLGLRAAGALASFVLVWLVARMFGADAVGLYQLGVTTATTVSMFVSLGLDILLVREVGPLLSGGQADRAMAIYRAMQKLVLRAGVAMLVLLVLLAPLLSDRVLDQPEALAFLQLSAPIVLLLPLLKLANAFLRSRGDVVLSQSLEGVFYSGLAALGLGLVWFFGADSGPLLPPALYVGGLLLATGVGLYAVHRMVTGDPLPAVERPDTMRGAAIIAPQIIQMLGDWLLLVIVTAWLSVADTGIYRTAFQIALLLGIVYASFGLMASPHLAKAAAGEDRGEIFRILRSVRLLGLALCLPAAIGIALLADPLLGLFGETFVSGALALQLLLLGQLVNVGFGPVGGALVMMKREGLVAGIEVVATLAGMGLAAALIAPYGLAGAAAGALAAVLIRNLAQFIALHWVARRMALSQ
ncbi:MAG: oligosaccharide flippase family protein [Erythrobacter sp.]|nr:MAG: oligosaccharide flippase family protein [Erythrobacter sp.]